MKIEKMTRAHLNGVCAIENECFVHPWSMQSLENELESENSLFLTAVENGEVEGYIGMNVVLDEGYIYNVAVSEQYRQKGIGTALVNELVTYAKKNNLSFLTLEVRESNKNARSLYSKMGFIKAGRRKDYYSQPKESAILMTRYFSNEV